MTGNRLRAGLVACLAVLMATSVSASAYTVYMGKNGTHDGVTDDNGCPLRVDGFAGGSCQIDASEESVQFNVWADTFFGDAGRAVADPVTSSQFQVERLCEGQTDDQGVEGWFRWGYDATTDGDSGSVRTWDLWTSIFGTTTHEVSIDGTDHVATDGNVSSEHISGTLSAGSTYAPRVDGRAEADTFAGGSYATSDSSGGGRGLFPTAFVLGFERTPLPEVSTNASAHGIWEDEPYEFSWNAQNQDNCVRSLLYRQDTPDEGTTDWQGFRANVTNDSLPDPRTEVTVSERIEDEGCTRLEWRSQNGNEEWSSIQGQAWACVDTVDPRAQTDLVCQEGSDGDPETDDGFQDGWCQAAVEVTYAARDATSGLDRLEGRLGSDTVCEESWNLSGSPPTGPTDNRTCTHLRETSTDALREVTAFGRDQALRTGDQQASFGVDRHEPVPEVLAECDDPGEGGWCTGNVTLTLAASDAHSGLAAMRCTLDGDAHTCGTSTVRAEGEHTAATEASDVAGWTASETATYRIDAAPPRCEASAPPVAVSNYTVEWTCTEEVSGFDGDLRLIERNPPLWSGGQEVCRTPVAGTGTLEGECQRPASQLPGRYCYQVVVEDVAGHEERTPGEACTVKG